MSLERSYDKKAAKARRNARADAAMRAAGGAARNADTPRCTRKTCGHTEADHPLHRASDSSRWFPCNVCSCGNYLAPVGGFQDNYDDDDQPPPVRGWQDVGGYVQYGWFTEPPADVQLLETPGAYYERIGAADLAPARATIIALRAALAAAQRENAEVFVAGYLQGNGDPGKPDDYGATIHERARTWAQQFIAARPALQLARAARAGEPGT